MQQSVLSVQQSDGLGKKTVIEPGGPTPHAAEPLSGGQQNKQTIMGVRGVATDFSGPRYTAVLCNVLNGGKRSADDSLCCPHHSSHILPVRGTTASTPH